MDFREHFEGVYEGGVIRPVQPLDLPEHTRVEGTVEAKAPERASATKGCSLPTFRRAQAEKWLRPDARPLTRDEMHERR